MNEIKELLEHAAALANEAAKKCDNGMNEMALAIVLANRAMLKAGAAKQQLERAIEDDMNKTVQAIIRKSA